MSEVKAYEIKGKWLVVRYKGFFSKKTTSVLLRHVRSVSWEKRIVKWLFIASLVELGVTGAYLYLDLTDPLVDFSEYLMLYVYAFLVGVAMLVVSVLAGGKSIVVRTDSESAVLPGMRKKSKYEEFFSELSKAVDELG
ncbi:MAG: hypothetical protein Kow0069_29190 [Promethearchaeota archaeon]